MGKVGIATGIGARRRLMGLGVGRGGGIFFPRLETREGMGEYTPAPPPVKKINK